MTLRPEGTDELLVAQSKARKPTLGTEGDADSLRENVDASQDGRTALVGELDVLVRATGQRWLRRTGGSAADSGVGGASETMHDSELDERRKKKVSATNTRLLPKLTEACRKSKARDPNPSYTSSNRLTSRQLQDSEVL